MPTTPVDQCEVADLDATGVLAMAAEAEQAERAAALLKLRLAHQWAVLHPATTETGVTTPTGAALDVLTKAETLGGEGTPTVAAFTPETLALHLDLSPSAGAALIGDALDLVHRLPLLWKRVQTLHVPVWAARRVAQQTRRLNCLGVRWVDQQLAARTDGSLGPIVTDRLVALAIAKYDVEEIERREAKALAASEVTLTHASPDEYAGTSDLFATGDTATLKAFHHLVCAIAHHLHRDGDTSPLGVRKIKAIGLITTLVVALSSRSDASDFDAGMAAVLAGAAKQRTGKARLYAHVDAADLEVDLDGNGETAFGVGRVERLGAATIAKLRQWVGHNQVTIVPVLNMQKRDAVDQHDPPEWMAELVRLRDGHCIFPRCTIDARDCDIDHEEPYIPIEEGGPPGQTHPDALACLCRRHHRAKTARVWRYTRTPEGHYLWHGPHNARYRVLPDAGGTRRLA